MKGLAVAVALAFLGGAVMLPQSVTAATYSVTIADMSFGAALPNLKVGDTVEWINADIFEHSATARDGSFDVRLPSKARGRTVLRRAGRIAFYCRFHPGMTGYLVVSP
jgi:plastocyanin